MTPQEQLENELKAITFSWRDNPEMIAGYKMGYMDGGLKGMEIQKEIGTPKFKTLKDWGWKIAGAQTFHCRTQMVSYEVFYSPSRDGYRWCEVGEPSLPCDSIDHGKQLAQKDYEEKCNQLLKDNKAE